MHEPINLSVSTRLSMIVLSANNKDLTGVSSTFSNFKFLSNRFVNKMLKIVYKSLEVEIFSMINFIKSEFLLLNTLNYETAYLRGLMHDDGTSDMSIIKVKLRLENI